MQENLWILDLFLVYDILNGFPPYPAPLRTRSEIFINLSNHT